MKKIVSICITFMMIISLGFINVKAASNDPTVTAKASANGKVITVTGSIASNGVSDNQITIKVLNPDKTVIEYLNQTTVDSNNNYQFIFTLPDNAESGTYHVIILGKEAALLDYVNNSSSPQIISIEDITATVNQWTAYSLPSVVTAKMSDGTTKQVSVTWDNSTGVNTSAPGSYKFLGSVGGYTGKVTLTLVVNQVYVQPTNNNNTPAPASAIDTPAQQAANGIDEIIKDGGKSQQQKEELIKQSIKTALEKASTLSIDTKLGDNGIAALDESVLNKLLQDTNDVATAISGKMNGIGINAPVSKELTLDASKAEANGVSVPETFVDNAVKQSITMVNIKTKTAIISFNPSTISDEDKANAKQITIAANKLTQDQVKSPVLGLDLVYQKLIGTNPVYEFSMKADERQIHKFNPNSPVAITVPYTLASGESEKNIHLYYIDEKGNLIGVESSKVNYNGASKQATFTVEHFSKYVVMPKLLSANFADVDAKYIWAKDAIDKMVAAGVISGKNNSLFAPGENVTRAEFIKMIDLVFGLKPTGASAFSDVKSSKWYSPYIAAAQNAGIIRGAGDGKFLPDAAISRQDMCVMIVNAMKAMNKNTLKPNAKNLKRFGDVSNLPDYAKDQVSIIVGMKIITGITNSKFAPTDKTTRAQAAVVMYRIFTNINK